MESCQTDVCEVKRDMIAIKHEIDSVQLVKDEIDDIRESLDRLEAESQRRKNKLLEQVNPYISHFFPSFNITVIYLTNAFFLSRVSHSFSPKAYSQPCSACFSSVTIRGSSTRRNRSVSER